MLSFLSGLLLVLINGVVATSFSDLGIPSSSATVDVKAFSAVASITAQADTFVFPTLSDRQALEINVYCFLIQHNNDRVMFDIGFRKDYQNLAPYWTNIISSGVITVDVEEDIPTQLQNGNISLDSVSTVIWSHSHADHIGDMSLWPNTTELVIGEATDTRTYPTFANASLLDSDFAGRTVTKVSFTNSAFHFGNFPAVDYFGDGSLYLLDAPGHCPGHMAALARVTPTSFILLSGDTFHQAGEVRPSPHLHETFPVSPAILDSSRQNIARQYFWAPDDDTDLSNRTRPFLGVANGADSFYFDPVTSTVSQYDVGVFDANPDIFVFSSHDPTMENITVLFPQSLSDWKEQGWKEQGVWQFANVSNRGYRLS